MLPQITEAYPKLQAKYTLPVLSELNKDFELDKIDVETEYLARTIRKCMMDKVVNSLNFLDMLLSPQQAPRLYLPYLQTMTVQDRKLIEQLYSAFGTLSVACLGLELSYVEQKEGEMIGTIAKVWDAQRSAFAELVGRIGNPAPVTRKEKSYAG